VRGRARPGGLSVVRSARAFRSGHAIDSKPNERVGSYACHRGGHGRKRSRRKFPGLLLYVETSQFTPTLLGRMFALLRGQTEDLCVGHPPCFVGVGSSLNTGPNLQCRTGEDEDFLGESPPPILSCCRSLFEDFSGSWGGAGPCVGSSANAAGSAPASHANPRLRRNHSPG
jgi:hypothetical protein